MSEHTTSHLLVVEDDQVNRLLMGRYLQNEGHQVTFAVDGRQAIELLYAISFDMILLDIEMPVVNGYQVLEHIISDPRLRETPVIVTSALDQLESVVRCIEMGAEDYLTKPVNRVLLKARIDASLEKKRLRDIQTAALKRLKREMEIARLTQMSILPNALPQAESYDFGALIIPARAVGGDFYDFIPMPSHIWGIVIGDVSDKGLPAALYMTLTYSLLRVEASHGNTPAQALQNVNQYLLGMNTSSMFVTVLCGILDPIAQTFTYARAGHPAPLLLNPDGQIQKIPSGPSQAVGIFDPLTIDTAQIAIPQGSTLLLFSDGVTEALNPDDQQYDELRLPEILKTCHHNTAQEICQILWQDVQTHSGPLPQQDDFTLVVVKHI